MIAAILAANAAALSAQTAARTAHTTALMGAANMRNNARHTYPMHSHPTTFTNCVVRGGGGGAGFTTENTGYYTITFPTASARVGQTTSQRLSCYGCGAPVRSGCTCEYCGGPA